MSVLDLFSLSGTSVLFITLNLIILLFIINQNKNPKNFPPGPRGLPLVGNIFNLDLKRPYQTLMEMKDKFGPVFSIQMGLRKMVVLCGYEMVKEALVTQADQFAERPDIPLFKQITRGNGIIFGHGDSWRTIRRFTLTVLRDLGMGKRNIEEKIIEESENLVKSFAAHNGDGFQTTIPLNAAASNIIVSLIMGHRMEYDDPIFIKLLEMNYESFRLASGPFIQLYNMYPVIHPLPGPHHRVLAYQDNLKAFFRKSFIQHRQILDENDSRSYIDAFLNKQQEEKDNPSSHFHEWNLLCSVTNMFVAGTDTTSSTLAWALVIMIKYPDIQSKVHEEIDKVIGGSTLRIQHRQMMPFTDAVIHETQRFADILPMDLPHETTADVSLNGFFIPKGTYIIPLLRSVHRDKAHWEKPDDFYPHHFLTVDEKFVKREAFMPFSAGRRVCVGETLARMELFLFYTSLMQRFSFHPPIGMTADDVDLSTCGGLGLAPPPIKVRALPRCHDT
ncbi:cytochrome P450 2K1 isoform X1 [Coregonus clupeaformis]|uniref:cytochrome P450 2K1 isoform X1 n=2 Tax=Coregonus clupeaformis TaxID=59861 RepID=UPI001E1C298D|nr:cytochrome P450 2K1 isoform X1 [Coregonus clupeaformis]